MLNRSFSTELMGSKTHTMVTTFIKRFLIFLSRKGQNQSMTQLHIDKAKQSCRYLLTLENEISLVHKISAKRFWSESGVK